MPAKQSQCYLTIGASKIQPLSSNEKKAKPAEQYAIVKQISYDWFSCDSVDNRLRVRRAFSATKICAPD